MLIPNIILPRILVKYAFVENTNDINSNCRIFTKRKMQIIFNHRDIHVTYNKSLVHNSAQLETEELAAIIYFEKASSPLKQELRRISEQFGGITNLKLFFDSDKIEEKKRWLRERICFYDIVYDIDNIGGSN